VKNRSLYIARLIASSFYQRARFALGRIDSDSGSNTTVQDIEAAAAYIERTFDDYARYGGWTPGELAGKSFLEAGPGDNLGTGLLFLAHGAARYATIDKFYSRHDPERARAIHERLERNFPGTRPAPFDPSRIESVYGHGAQEADKVFPAASFDGILSRAVLHEIYEAEAALAALDRVLKPGGWMMHKIDLRDDGLFSGHGFHPLEFLTISGPVYWLISYNTDKTCRRPLPVYRDIMRRLGYEARFLITGIIETSGYRAAENPAGQGKETLTAGVDYGDEHASLLESIRPRLSAPFRCLSGSDLLTAGVFLAARKPL
jgi:SAM-dependent methyltransferase